MQAHYGKQCASRLSCLAQRYRRQPGSPCQQLSFLWRRRTMPQSIRTPLFFQTKRSCPRTIGNWRQVTAVRPCAQSSWSSRLVVVVFVCLQSSSQRTTKTTGQLYGLCHARTPHRGTKVGWPVQRPPTTITATWPGAAQTAMVDLKHTQYSGNFSERLSGEFPFR